LSPVMSATLRVMMELDGVLGLGFMG